jgi:hypothetical protein
VLCNAHPQTLVTERWLEDVRSSLRAEQPTKKAGKAASAARRNERAAAPALSPRALAEADARASVAEAELLAMLGLEEPEAVAAKSKNRGKATRRCTLIRDTGWGYLRGRADGSTTSQQLGMEEAPGVVKPPWAWA